MSLFNDNAGNGHVSIAVASPMTGLGSSAFTVAFLHSFKLFEGSSLFWKGYKSDGFSIPADTYADNDVYVGFNSLDLNFDSGADVWHWIVVTRDAVAEPARVHFAPYSASGALAWTHGDVSGVTGLGAAINRISIGDEFGTIMRGNLACFGIWLTEMSDAVVESTIERSSAQLLASSPDFFMHWPQADGVVFDELIGGGGVVPGTLTGTWNVSADPPGYDFSLAPARTGQPKIWNGSAWVNHPLKVWNGSAWVERPVKGHDGTDWVLSK